MLVYAIILLTSSNLDKNMFFEYFEYLPIIFTSPALLLLIEIISCALKIYLMVFLVSKAMYLSKVQKQLFLLLMILACSIFIDFSWIVSIIQKNWFPVTFCQRIALFIIRFAWAINYILFLCLGFFVESLCEKNYILKVRQKLLVMSGIPWVAYFIGIAFFQFTVIARHERLMEIMIKQTGRFIMLFILVLPILYYTIVKIRTGSFPKILKKQVKLLISCLIFPFILIQLLDLFSAFRNNPYLSVLSNAFLSYAIYFAITRIMRLRFLNFEENIQPPQRSQFIDCFKTFLGSLAKVKSLNEIGFIVQTYFKDFLGINPIRVTLYYRQRALDVPQEVENDPYVLTSMEAAVEKVVNNPVKNEKLLTLMRKQQILMYDEIEFSNFYQEEQIHKEALAFMNEVQAEVFLPIFEQHNLIAYLIITRQKSDKKQELFNNLEHDQMVILGSYLGHIITMLQLNNYRVLLAQNKQLNEHLYQTHQEKNRYRESIQSFLRDNRQRQTGILFYKNYHFTFANQAAKELISVNINALEGHLLTKALKALVKAAEEYKTMQSSLVNDGKGNILVLTALPHLEKNNIIITVAYPEISDVVKQQADQLRNPSEWEYLLYLQTTQSGKLINRLIPGYNTLLLSFKIEVLQASLSKKAVILDVQEDDLDFMVDLLHSISLRENIHKLTMNSYEKGNAIAVKLFGMNPLFGTFEQPLLEQLNNVGTLFIQNVHLLEINTQETLAEFIKYGYFTVCHSNKRVFADVRVICSTTQNLQTLVQEGKFSKALFEELSKTKLTMPSLFDLSDAELDEVIKEFSQQEIRNADDFKKLLEFTARDKEQLMKTRSVSLSGLRKKINTILVEKTKKHEIYHNVTFDPASHIVDSELAEASRLGKNALRDRKKLIMLMEKFDYNQNKVAAFLGVNRSSINRRLKAHKIEVYDDEASSSVAAEN